MISVCVFSQVMNVQSRVEHRTSGREFISRAYLGSGGRGPLGGGPGQGGN